MPLRIGRGSDATGLNSIAAGLMRRRLHSFDRHRRRRPGDRGQSDDVRHSVGNLHHARYNFIASRSAQSGPLQVVTSDADGHLASDGGAIFSQLDQLQSNDTKIFSELDKLNGVDKQLRSDIDTVQSGVAVAMSAVGPDLTGAERFGLSLNWGGFEGASAIGGGATAVVSRWNGSRLAVTGGIGVGLDDNSVGGRAGGQWTW